MGERGFPANPLAVRNRHRRVASNRPRPTPGRPPMPAEFIGRPEADVWERVCDSLGEMGLLFSSDWGQLERYVRLLVAHRECCQFLSKHGMTYSLCSPNRQVPHLGVLPGSSPPQYVVALVPYPQVKIRESLEKALRAIEAGFGLSPGARLRLTVEDSSVGEQDGPVVRFRKRE